MITNQGQGLMSDQQEEVYLALGSNRGDREQQLEQARSRLAEAVQIEAVSPIYITEPWGYPDQEDFLNQVVEGKTELAPHELLRFVKEIEEHMGREETFRYGPRVIDLDILLMGHRTCSGPDLEIPHPRMTERAFVMIPLLDLAPDLVIPGQDRTVREIAEALDQSGLALYRKPAEGDS
jgi:2-amino-4-hydroxy-6-hydroxymethyldihydropteridine diphosphokinase